MAVAITGSQFTGQFTGTDGTVSAITVPADADICIVLVSRYCSSATGVTDIDELNWDDGATVDFTHIGTSFYTYAAHNEPELEAYYMLSNSGDWPGSGSGKTLYVSFANASMEGSTVYVLFAKGIDFASPIRDSETLDFDLAAAGPTTNTSALSGINANDLTIGLCYAYAQSPNADPTGYGQTSLLEATYNSAGIGAGYEQGESAFRFENCSWSSCIWFALKVGIGAIAISPNASGHSHLAAQPAFTIERNVTPSASAHSHTAAQPTFTVERDIIPAASVHSHVAEQAGVTSAVYNISPAASLHSHISAQPTFTIERNITPAAISHSHVAAEPVFTVERDISPETASHTHAAAQPIFTVERDISPVSVSHFHAAAQPEFTVKREIAPSVAAHSHTAAQPEFTFERDIAPSAALHSHAAAQPISTVERNISPLACQHTHAVEQPVFTFERDVAPIDSAHVHTADSAGFTLHLTVSVNNGTHGHTCETLAFSFVRSMDPADSLHNHIAEYANVHETTGIMNYFGFNLFNGEVIMFRGRRTA